MKYFYLSAMKHSIIEFALKFYVAIATFKNLLKMAALKGCLNKADMEKVGKKL